MFMNSGPCLGQKQSARRCDEKLPRFFSFRMVSSVVGALVCVWLRWIGSDLLNKKRCLEDMALVSNGIQKMSPDEREFAGGPEARLTHRFCRETRAAGYLLSSCTSAELDSVLPGNSMVTVANRRPIDHDWTTGAMPRKPPAHASGG